MSKESDKKFVPNYYNAQVWLRLQAIEWNCVDKLDPEKIADPKSRELFDSFIKSYEKLLRYVLSYGDQYDDARRRGEFEDNQ